MYKLDDSQLIYLTIYELKLFAPASVNGKNTLAYLDTAASQITVSNRIAKNLPQKGKMIARSAFGEREFDTVSVRVKFLGTDIQDVEARIKKEDDPAPFRSDLTLDGNTLLSQPLIYDFHILGLLPAELFAADGEFTEEWTKIPSKFLDNGLCILEMKANDKILKAIFDTGAGLTVVNSAHGTENRLELKPEYEIEIHDATGAKSKQVINSCMGLQIGKMEIPPFDSFVSDLHDIEEALGERIDLVFGANSMLKSGLRWFFDRETNKVFVN